MSHIRLFPQSWAFAAILPCAFALAALAPAPVAFGAEEDESLTNTIEEIVVTSEKRQSTAQDTALALSAFDENALDRENIDDLLDIQFSVPNLLFSKSNFTGSNISIRGIGNNAVAASADGATGVHFNGLYLVASGLFESEFYDVARVEILRGPQGTLYGRNTTAGVINVIPNKPANEFKASGEMEFGDFGALKYKSTVNLPITSWFQVRSSLFRSKREGYVRNEETDNLIDDRDIVAGRLAFRLGGEADSPFELNIFYDHFLEEDKRLRQSKQVCHQDLSPYPNNLGCLPGQSLYEGDRFGSPTYFSTIAGFLGSIQPIAAGVVPATCATNTATCTITPPVPFITFPAALGIGQPDIAANSATNPEDLRTISAVIDPYYKVRDRLGAGELKWDLGGIEIHAVTGRQRRFFSSNNDYNGASGTGTFNPVAVATWNAVVAAGVCPATCVTAAAAGNAQAAAGLAAANQIRSLPFLYTADPILTGNGQSTNGRSSLFAWDWSFSTSETESTELRFLSDFGGFFNFMIGNFDLEFISSSGYQVHSNLLAAFSPANPELGYYYNDTQSYRLNSEATFAEFYFGGEDVRLTLGVRSTQETKIVNDRQTLLNSGTLPYVKGLTGRACLSSPVAYFVGWGSGGGCLNNAVPDHELRMRSFDEDTWKIGLDIQLSQSSLMYITRANSYKSGGLNPPAFTGSFPDFFAPEYIESLEIGFKNTIGGKANLNLTFFHYDYEGLQISKIVDRTAVNENINAINRGAELELAWVPTRNWRFDLTASLLDTEIQSGNSINPADPANAYTDGDATDARFRNTKNSDTSVFLVANPDAPSPYTFTPADCGAAMEGGTLQCSSVFTYGVQGTAANPVTGAEANPRAPGSVLDACTVAGVCSASSTVQQAADWLNALPRAEQQAAKVTCPEAVLTAALTAVGQALTGPQFCGAIPSATNLFASVPIGIAVDVTGNELPNSPEKSARLGMQYNIDLDGTNLSLRADYYWQSDFYYRIFNTRQDLIESWNVLNLQVSLTSLTGDWTMELWVKNARDKDFVTGAYFTDASSGNFTNLFLLEPRTVGVSFRFRY